MSAAVRRELRLVHEGLLWSLVVVVAAMVAAVLMDRPEAVVVAGALGLIVCRGLAEVRQEREALRAPWTVMRDSSNGDEVWIPWVGVPYSWPDDAGWIEGSWVPVDGGELVIGAWRDASLPFQEHRLFFEQFEGP